MSRIKTTLAELRKHFLNIPSFSLVYELPKESVVRLEAVNQEITKALQDEKGRLLFILSPYGMGKTTHVSYFLKKNPHLRSKYRSFLRVDSLRGVFFQLIHPFAQLLFVSLGIAIILGLCLIVPGPALFPIIAMAGLYFLKSFNQMAYFFQETIRNLFLSKKTLWILEDLERCPITDSERSYFLSSLWKTQSSYIITLGYSPEEKKERLKLIEGAIKLGGKIIEIFPDEDLNYALLKKLDEDMPFILSKGELKKRKSWLSLFTLREMVMIHEQVTLEMSKETEKSDTLTAKKLTYIGIALDLIKAKLNIPSEEPLFKKEEMVIFMPQKNKLNSSQSHFLLSFVESIDPALKLKVMPTPTEGMPSL